MRLIRVFSPVVAATALACSVPAFAQKGPLNVIYVNGIRNTLEDMQDDWSRIQEVLNASQNHIGSAKRAFVVTGIWNPIGWTGKESGLKASKEDLKELFLLKTGEEDFADDFPKIVVPFNASASVDKDAAKRISAYLYDKNLLPGGTSLETNGLVFEDDMAATKKTILQLIQRVKTLQPAIVVPHSEGNLLANLAYASLVSDIGNDVSKTLRIVDVANTSAFSANRLNITHAKDAALFAAASCLSKTTLEKLPSTTGWTRTTPACPNSGLCDFTIASPPLGSPETLLCSVSHNFRDTYLSNTIVPVVDTQGVAFTPGADRFVDRFEDFVYAAAASIDAQTSGGTSGGPNSGGTASYATLYSFGLTANDGQLPTAFLQGSDGAFYGTTFTGGANGNCQIRPGYTNGCGTVFKITSAGLETVLYSFAAGMDGLAPSSLIQSSDGNFYGTTFAGGGGQNCQTGGAYPGCGTVFKVTPTGAETQLYKFDYSADDISPYLVAGSNGDFYGFTQGDANRTIPGYGTIFKITSAGVRTVLYTFTGGADGGNPSSLITGNDGNFYGTTAGWSGNDTSCSNAGSCGTVFKMTPAGSMTVLYSFVGVTYGTYPGSLIQSRDGNFYGITVSGGSCTSSNNQCGTVFKVTPAGVRTVLHTFGGVPDGATPSALIEANDGNLYGVTQRGGVSNCVYADGCGIVFMITKGGAETILHTFTGSPDGSLPVGLTQGKDGKIYGVANFGGQYSSGTVFKVDVGLPRP